MDDRMARYSHLGQRIESDVRKKVIKWEHEESLETTPPLRITLTATKLNCFLAQTKQCLRRLQEIAV